MKRQHDDAIKEINQAMTVRIKASKDLKRLTEERNAAMQVNKNIDAVFSFCFPKVTCACQNRAHLGSPRDHTLTSPRNHTLTSPRPIIPSPHLDFLIHIFIPPPHLDIHTLTSPRLFDSRIHTLASPRFILLGPNIT